MFLEDKLEQVLSQNQERKSTLGVTQSLELELLNTCVDFICERVKPRDTNENVIAVIKQVDNVWKAFAKKHNFNLNFFRHEYIVPRFQDNKIIREQFRITPEEMRMIPPFQKK